MIGRLRRRPKRLVVVAAVFTTTVLTLGLVVESALSIGRTTTQVGDLAYAVTGSANAHREILKMEVATRRLDIGGLAEVKARRAFASQQLRLSLPGLTDRSDPNADVPRMLEGLAKVDALIAVDSQAGGVPSAALGEAVSQLEVDLKGVYDIEESRYFGLNRNALVAKTQSQALLIALAGLIFVSGAGILISLRKSARSNLQKKADELSDALAALEVAQADRGRLLDETVRASERERVRLAAELHDGPIQSIAALCFRLDRVGSKLVKGDHAGAVPLLDAARTDLGDEVTELRRFMSELRPPALDEDGLAGATRDYVNSFANRTGCLVSTTIEIDDKALIAEREVVLYRIVQESLTNISRHAEARNVAVVLRETSGGVELTITDDGIGFDTARTSDFVRNSHFGLAGMRERVEAADGEFVVVSTPGAGVQIRATLPIMSCAGMSASSGRSAA